MYYIGKAHKFYAKNPDYSTCPKVIKQINKGIAPDLAYPCRKQNCECPSCRASYYYKLGCACREQHILRPWSGPCIIRLPYAMNIDDALIWMRGRQKSITTACSRAKVKFDAILHPEQHGKGKIHWQGLFRIDDAKQLYRIRDLLPPYCRFVILKDWNYQLRYAVGQYKQYRCSPLVVDNKKCNCSIGTPFDLPQKELYKRFRKR